MRCPKKDLAIVAHQLAKVERFEMPSWDVRTVPALTNLMRSCKVQQTNQRRYHQSGTPKWVSQFLGLVKEQYSFPSAPGKTTLALWWASSGSESRAGVARSMCQLDHVGGSNSIPRTNPVELFLRTRCREDHPSRMSPCSATTLCLVYPHGGGIRPTCPIRCLLRANAFETQST